MSLQHGQFSFHDLSMTVKPVNVNPEYFMWGSFPSNSAALPGDVA